MNQTHSLPLEHWGLERWPFCAVPTADQLYPTASHNEALARIDYLVDSGRRLGVLLGEGGMGKSLVLQAAARQLTRRDRAVVAVDVLAVSARELLWQTAAGLGTVPSDDADAARLWRQIGDRLAENRLQQIHTALLVDGAGHAGPDVLAYIGRLARLETCAGARWTILLAAEPLQAARWNESIRNLADLRIDLRPWESEETVGFVQTALVEAGRVEPLFDEHALAALHELTRGVPRQVVRLADLALLAGAAAGLETIDAAIVEAAHDELAWPAVSAAAL